jgi:hypothetical protein
MNTGNIHVNAYTPVVGGIVSLGGNGVYDCVNVGKITTEVGTTEYCGGISYNSQGITNCYSTDSELSCQNGEICTADQLNSKAFYTDTLGWNEAVWDFSDLDAANGKYPKLK